jgi:hypothetical protein
MRIAYLCSQRGNQDSYRFVLLPQFDGRWWARQAETLQMHMSMYMVWPNEQYTMSSSRSKSPRRSARVAGNPAALQHQDATFVYPVTYSETEPFSAPHTVTVLVVLICFIAYALWNLHEASQRDSIYHVRLYVASRGAYMRLMDATVA